MSVKFENNEAFIRWNEEMTRKYDSEDYHLRSSFFIRWIEQRRVQAIVAFLQAGPADTVVEVGCGAGVVLGQIPAGRLIGMDLSGFILQKTRRRLSHRAATLLQGNAEKLPLANGRYAKVLCTEVIEHVLEPRHVARELARIASDEAVVVITIPNEALIDGVKAWITRLGLSRWLLQGSHPPQAQERAYDSPDEANEWHLHRFDMPLLRRVTEGVLTITAVRAIPFAWLPFRYVVACRKLAQKEK